jgi:anti-anti-sigma regulatory factor
MKDAEMENRQGSRIALTLEVDIALRAWPLGRFLTRNVSRDGMFLEIGASTLKPGDIVSLVVRLSHGPLSINAVVVHSAEAGIGVMLTSESPEYARFIQRALGCSQPVLRPPWASTAESPAPVNWSPAMADGIAVPGGLRWGKRTKTLVLHIGERLDLSVNELVQQAIQSIATKAPERVVFDLAATHKVFDSGVALLLLLRNRAGDVKDWIYLANCAPRIINRLVRAGLASRFQIV